MHNPTKRDFSPHIHQVDPFSVNVFDNVEHGSSPRRPQPTATGLYDKPPDTEQEAVIVLHQDKSESRISMTKGDIAKAYGVLANSIKELPHKPDTIGANSKFGDWFLYLPYDACVALAKVPFMQASNAQGEQAQLDIAIRKASTKDEAGQGLDRSTIDELTAHIIIRLQPGWQTRRIKKHHIITAFKAAGFAFFRGGEQKVKVGDSTFDIGTGLAHELCHSITRST